MTEHCCSCCHKAWHAVLAAAGFCCCGAARLRCRHVLLAPWASYACSVLPVPLCPHSCCAPAGVTTEKQLLSPENEINPDYYMTQLSDLLAVKQPASAMH